MQSPFDSVHCGCVGQVGSTAQEPVPLQSVSHEHESRHQAPLAQLPVPLHSTLHGPMPQVINPWHVLASLQRIVQEVAAEQFTAPKQAEVPAQCTSQGMPVAQVTPAEQEPAALHSMVQVPSTQDVQVGGQLPASGGEASGGMASGLSLASAGCAPSTEPSSSGCWASIASTASGSVEASICELGSTHHPSRQTRPSRHSFAGEQRYSSERASNWQAATASQSAGTAASRPRGGRTIIDRPGSRATTRRLPERQPALP